MDNAPIFSSATFGTLVIVIVALIGTGLYLSLALALFITNNTLLRDAAES